MNDDIPLENAHRDLLLDVAIRSIRRRMSSAHAPAPALEEFPDPVRHPAGSFVTLTREGTLRGCRGHIEAVHPLVHDVWESAQSSAFDDPRFPPLTAGELPGLTVEVSVLSPMTDVPAASRAELLDALRPGEDGLLLVAGHRRATFLPTVWSTLPDPVTFLEHLFRKAGLPAEYWESDLRFRRYGTQSFHRLVES